MGPVGGQGFEHSVKFANDELVSNSMVWLSAHDHIWAYHSTSIPAASSVFLLMCECSGKNVL